MNYNSKDTAEVVVNTGSYNFKNNGLEDNINEYKENRLKNTKFSIITKHIIISLIALVGSYFLDISSVPLIGNITTSIAKDIFPQWEPINESIQPISFWWMPFLCYLIFLLFAYKTYYELRKEVKESTSAEIIDKITNSSISVIDGISTALPLIGAAILLISIKLGPEVFLGLSVPFEIKALIVLAIGKLFEPVLEEMAVEFQHIINRANDIKKRYMAQNQIDNLQKIISHFESIKLSDQAGSVRNSISIEELSRYEESIGRIKDLSKQIYVHYKATFDLFEKMNSLQNLNSQKLAELSALADKINAAASSLNNDTTLRSLQTLESLIVKK